MNVTREIVRDLLPLVAAGEASAESREAVEAWLRQDPELAALAEALRQGETAPPAPPSSPDRARAALSRTKRLLSRRSWLMSLALFFTGLPLAFVADESGLRFLMIRDAPAAATGSLAVGIALWIAFAVTVRRMRVPGL